jgi:isopenicillin-N N-acyltransferase-like protein
LRWAIVDLARWRFRGLEATLPPERRREIAAYAAGFQPDPFGVGMGTYQRFVLLNSLYDIMLAFERSPLIGCSSLVLRGEAAGRAHTLLGRNFDFEGPSVLDRDKALFLVHELGRIPYASVSWPGFVGVASGMNALGVGIVVHGARAKTPQPSGDPVTMTVRELLGTARDTAEAVALLEQRRPMVPHILLVADASGDVAVVERAPGEAAAVRRPTGARVALTNHFEGPWATDPANQAVLEHTSSRTRRQRLDELLANLPAGASVEQVVSLLRDKRGKGNVDLPLGHRSAIDALIATHSVVMDLTGRELWVSEGPHAAGRYLRFDLARLLDPGFRPSLPEPLVAISADELLADGRYQRWLDAGSPRQGAE